MVGLFEFNIVTVCHFIKIVSLYLGNSLSASYFQIYRYVFEVKNEFSLNSFYLTHGDLRSQLVACKMASVASTQKEDDNGVRKNIYFSVFHTGSDC